MSHTPAPWFIEGKTVYALEHYGWKKGVEQFCNRFTVSIGRGQSNADGELEANARLIAAAPELLAACIEFVRKVDAGEAKSTRSYEQMKAAIAKSKGEQA